MDPIISLTPGMNSLTPSPEDMFTSSPSIPNRICGLSWSPDNTVYRLSVGTNDCIVFIYEFSPRVFTTHRRFLDHSISTSTRLSVFAYLRLLYRKSDTCAYICTPEYLSRLSSLSTLSFFSTLSPASAASLVVDRSNAEARDTMERSLQVAGLRVAFPCAMFDGFSSAIKALQWNPKVPDLLATGGGRFDRQVRLIDTTRRVLLGQLDTQHQITGVQWDREGIQLLVSHGFDSFQMRRYEIRFSKLTQVQVAVDAKRRIRKAGWNGRSYGYSQGTGVEGGDGGGGGGGSRTDILLPAHSTEFVLVDVYVGHTGRILSTSLDPTRTQGT